MPQKEVMSEAERKMKNAVEAFRHELKTIRTGRASIALLESVKVPYYGTDTPIQQVANLSVSDATTLLVQPFDASIIGAVDKAIRTAELGLNPVTDGKVIRVPVPKLTEDRRKELVKKAHQMAEQAKNEVRAHRRDGNDRLKKMGRGHEISEDDEKRAHDELQKLHDRYIDEIGSTLSSKEKDILTV